MVELGSGGAQRQKSYQTGDKLQDMESRSLENELTVDVVDHGSLAHGILVFGGGVADVVADLRTTDGCGVVVNLVGLEFQVISSNERAY
jgi:hypothetical protein